ncbi:MAG: hypothetical protein L6Q83_02350 [Gammaproteobacteria bacterium]|nr:hypothetical protein [Gammaproteobacteria bacterium]
MLTPRQEIARERRRQMQVRRALAAGLREQPVEPERAAGFFLACVDHLRFCMDRLQRQDGMIHALLRDRIPAGDRDAHARLAAVDEQLGRSRMIMDDLGRAADALQKAGQSGVGDFVMRARTLDTAFTALARSARNPMFDYTSRLLSDVDWERVAGVDDEAVAEEERLFEAVRRYAPPGADPASMADGHPTS